MTFWDWWAKEKPEAVDLVGQVVEEMTRQKENTKRTIRQIAKNIAAL